MDPCYVHDVCNCPFHCQLASAGFMTLAAYKVCTDHKVAGFTANAQVFIRLHKRTQIATSLNTSSTNQVSRKHPQTTPNPHQPQGKLRTLSSPVNLRDVRKTKHQTNTPSSNTKRWTPSSTWVARATTPPASPHHPSRLLHHEAFLRNPLSDNQERLKSQTGEQPA